MTVPDDIWRAPQAGRPEAPYGGFYPALPVGYLPAAIPVEETPVDVRGEVTTGLIALAVCLFVGTPLGFIWAALRPHFNVLVVSAAEESALKPQFTADMKLAGLGLAAGAVAGIVAWVLVKRNGTGAAVGLAIGGFLAMEVAAHVGKLAAHPENLRAVVDSQLPAGETLSGTTAEINSFLDLMKFQLRSPGVLFSFSVAALLLFGVLTLIKDRAAHKPYRLSLGGEPRPVSGPGAGPAPGAGTGASSGSAAAGSAPGQGRPSAS